ncbi:dTDP-4-dehydrorhamnose reductase [Candidatus Roizmanbacteria bacterium]|nr:dTDP-4-dehydrorhamnose reductase [Candidatus Roizmanbacteria bacterium]
MRLLLIGKNGQIGAEINHLAKNYGFEIFAFSKEELDITDVENLKKKIIRYHPDFIINASAYHVLPDCEKYPENAFKINASCLKELAEICSEKEIKLVHFSTSYVFDGKKKSPYSEQDYSNPLQIYGISKLAGEQIVWNYCKECIIIRTCAVFGGKTGSRSKKGNFLLNIIDQANGKKELEVSGEQIISPSYAVDVAEATLKLLKKKKAAGIYNFINRGICSWADLAKEVVKVKKINTKIVPVDRGGMAGVLRRPLNSSIINTRAKRLGIVLPHWRDGVKRYLLSLN